MERKLGFAIVILGLAAFSPAPINQAKGPRHFHPEMSQDQVAKQQAANGVIPVVGQVPRVTNDAGMALPTRGSIASQSSGDRAIIKGTEQADKVAGTITQASNRIESEVEPNRLAWFWGLLIAAVGYGAWKVFQYKIEKNTPVPQFSKRLLKEFENGKF